ncbi:methyltransferase domain-containing protein [Paracoccus limosus]|uniref:Methyltransferase domain-containing protein n=1 Tax=Paracoccus limosus TaxID=913252 RepID=A0A844H6P1_9RHOB|nr:methyltransferase domain-containing protein [Paracoccus limosus]MTH36432.1 methyltransferase domain-containing protein [Paracoccus limosus]
MSEGPVAPSMTSLMEGYYVVRLLDAFHHEGLIERLSAGATVDDISNERGYAPARLAALLDYLSVRSDVVRKTAAGYFVDMADPETRFALHLLDQYAGAYGPCLNSVPEILSGRVDGAALVDQARHAAAFACADRDRVDEDLLRLLAELRVDALVDLGCSVAGLLIEYALRHPQARGIGVDSSPSAIAAAQRRIAENGLSERLRVVRGDLRQVGALLGPDERNVVQCVVATNVANSFFGDDDGAQIDGWFAALRSAFPSRIMLLGDYFGSLSQPLDDPVACVRGLFHDVAQVLSGQGVPPCNLVQWSDILVRNGCTPIRAFEGNGGDMRRFIVLLQL